MRNREPVGVRRAARTLSIAIVSEGRIQTFHWRHNDQDGVSNHQPHDCSLNCLFRRRSKKTSKLCVTGLCVGNSPGPVNSPHKGPVTRKMLPFDDVIMKKTELNTAFQIACDDDHSWLFVNTKWVWWCIFIPSTHYAKFWKTFVQRLNEQFQQSWKSNVCVSSRSTK